jgi:cyclopropane-fatty-acyl-phospholipid synthase
MNSNVFSEITGRQFTVGTSRGKWTSWILRRLISPLANNLVVGPMTIGLPNGDEVIVRGTNSNATDADGARIDLRRGRGIRRMLTGGAMGFARGYIDGDWDSPDLVAAIELTSRNEAALDDAFRAYAPATTLNRLRRVRHLMRPNTRTGSQRNIARHYDLGNAFYRLWLDDGMTYSAALFSDPSEDLGAAQRAKYRRLADALDLRPGMHVLEIGCGWGGFAETVAHDYGCRVTAITVSREQHAYARERIAQAGLADMVDVRFQDYRDVEGTFDRIASIEMLEAVGERYWPVFLRVLGDRLAPGGIVGLQVITIEDARFESYRRSADFIQTYIFPGGMLPSPMALDAMARDGGFRIDDAFYFGLSYAETLARWRERFEAASPEIFRLGFDERFRRIWRYYLAYSEAGFRCGAVDVGQFVLRRDAV